MPDTRLPGMADQTQFARGRMATTLRVVLGLIVGVTFVVLVLRSVDFAEVGALLSRASFTPLALAFFAFVADFLLRAVRFWMMLLSTTGRRLSLRPTIGPFIASFGMNDILPFRVGDGFRVLWFSRQFKIPPGTVLGTMIVERILDLVTIVLLGGVSLALVGASAPPGLVWNFQLVLGVALAGGIGLLFAPALLCQVVEWVFGWINFAPLAKLIAALRATSAAILQIGSWRRLTMLTVLSLVLWVLESIVLVGVWMSLGGSLGAVMKPFLAFVFSTLGTLVPSLPGHFGTFEYFGIQAFALTGVDASMAAAVLLLAHLILWAPTAIFGVVWLLFGAGGRFGTVHDPAL